MSTEPITVEDDEELLEERAKSDLLSKLGSEWLAAAEEVWAKKPRSQEARDLRKQGENLSASAVATIEYWRRHHVDPGYVYFAATTNYHGYPHGPVKIGYAIDPIKRMGELQCGNSGELRAFELVLGTPDLERYLHRWLRHLRYRGEWFYTENNPTLLIDRARNAAVAQVDEHRRNGCHMRFLRGELVHPILVPGGRW